MKTIQHHIAIILVAGTILLICGCDNPRDTPGHLEPGNSIGVAQQALGSGSMNGTGYNDAATIGALPWVDYRAPNIPVMQDGVVDYLYFTAMESDDGEAERDEHFVKVKVQEQSFTKAHRNNQKSLLNDAQQGGIEREGMIPKSARLRNSSSGTNDFPLPMVRAGGQPQTRVTVAEMDPQGRTRVVGSENMPRPAAAGNADQPNGQDVQRMLEYFNQQQQARANQTPSTVQPNAAGTSSVPGAAR